MRYSLAFLGKILGFFLCLVTPSLSQTAEEKCVVPQGREREFLKISEIKTRPENLQPVAHAPDPLPDDCEFYLRAWENFLYATMPNENNEAAFLRYKTYADVFGMKPSPRYAKQDFGPLNVALRGPQFPDAEFPTMLVTARQLTMDDFRQAGVNTMLVDQNGNPVFYALHLNDMLVKFIEDYKLNTVAGLEDAPKSLSFRTGAVELKSAWMIVDPENPPRDYILAKAMVPLFKMAGKKIEFDGAKMRPVTVAMLALHVVTAIEGHPELVWATFEHVNHGKTWENDVAPAAVKNPGQKPLAIATPAGSHFSLYPDTGATIGAPLESANKIMHDDELKLIDYAKQLFAPTTPAYRVYPSSVRSEKDTTPEEDDAVVALNSDIESLFTAFKLENSDVRSNYKLVGATWLNYPDTDFKDRKSFSGENNELGEPLLGGENRLSSTAIESFTQDETNFSFGSPNCFSCHNTLTAPAGRISISHLFSKFLRDQQTDVSLK
jgi:hypothetical protein